MRYSKQFISVLIVALFAVGIVANPKLPGQTLYSYKVNVNEPVRTFLQFTSARKSRFEVMLVDRRLAEVSQLLLQNKLDENAYTAWKDSFVGATNAVASRVLNVITGANLDGYAAAVEEKGIFDGYTTALKTIPIKNTEFRDRILADITAVGISHEHLITASRNAAHDLYSKQQFIGSLDDQIYDLETYVAETNQQLTDAQLKLPKELFAALVAERELAAKVIADAKNNRAKDFYVDGSLSASDAHELSHQIRIFIQVWNYGDFSN